MIEWLLVGLMAGLVAGLVVLSLSQRSRIKDQEQMIHGLQVEVRKAHEATDKTKERMIEQVIMLRKEGFQTIPEDERFDTYRITPEQEAAWEDEKLQGVGGAVSPENLVGE